MVWAVLVAVGVAIVSMTLFGARLTRRPVKDSIVDNLETEADPNDPWAAWKPRPFEELDRPRPRVWPVMAAFTGLVLMGAGFAGARQTLWAAPTADASTTQAAVVTPRPYTVQVDIPPTPTPKPTPVPTPTPVPATPKPVVTAAPAAPTPSASQPAATTAPAGTGPTLTGSAWCTGGNLHLNYNATANGSPLSWIAVYVDGKNVKGGPISGNAHSSSYQGPGSSGNHDLEVSVQDKAGRTSRKQFGATCA
jgi:hypothetical protein